VPRALAETVALLLLAATLWVRGGPASWPARGGGGDPGCPAHRRPRHRAVDRRPWRLRSLAPTIGFLAAVLVLAELCDREGLFEAAGRRMAAGARGRPVALLGLVFVAGSAITAVLSLDATVVLLTPVVFATAVRLQLRPKPHVYACTQSGQLGLAAVASVESDQPASVPGQRPVLHSLRGRDGAALAGRDRGGVAGAAAVLRQRPGWPRPPGQEPPAGTPRYAVTVLALTLVGFGLASPLGVDPAVVAALGAAALAIPALARGRVQVGDLARAVAVPFLLFVAALGVVVRAVSEGGLGQLVEQLVPGGGQLWSLLAVAVVAGLLANLVNNLPAILLLLPAAAAAGPGTVLAALIGVNVGPNLTYVGSLATLLWRRVLHEHDAEPAVGEFLRLGALTVPAGLAAATLALWLALRVLG
jgi:arsenical pump membrane protein